MDSTVFPVILALDVPTRESAIEWVRRLRSEIGIFKVGMQLFYQYGPDIVREIQDEGAEVFLDLKLHDIPNTVAHACESILPLAPAFLTTHISGGKPMLEAAQSVITGSSTRLLGITALTSLSPEILGRVYPENTQSPSQWAVHLAGVAQEAGLFGVVCSAQENTLMREAWGTSLCLVNPGIRPAGSDVQDQKRVQAPLSAMQSGGNYLVMGRPILEATDPLAVIQSIRKELHNASGLPA